MKKRSLVALALMVMVTFGAAAQQPGRQGRMTPEQRIEKLTELLDLTPTQVAELKALDENRSELSKQKGKRPSREQMQKQQKEQQTQLKQILTAEQYKKFEKIMRRHQSEARKNRP